MFRVRGIGVFRRRVADRLPRAVFSVLFLAHAEAMFLVDNHEADCLNSHRPATVGVPIITSICPSRSFAGRRRRLPLDLKRGSPTRTGHRRSGRRNLIALCE
jgi:hypothetical protein